MILDNQTQSSIGNSIESPSSLLPGIKPNSSRRSPWGRGANWAVMLTVAVLLMISVGGYWYHRQQLAGIADEDLRLIVTGPAVLHAGVAADYTVQTTSVTGKGMPAQIEFAIYSPDDRKLWIQKEKSDQRGQLQITVPADLKLPETVRMEVLALKSDQHEKMLARLAVEPVRYITQLVTDRFEYSPGDTVYYRTITLAQYSLAADRQPTIRFEVLAPDGSVLPNSRREIAAENGISSGEFVIPDKQPAGQYSLIARSIDASFSTQRQEFLVGQPRAGGQQKKEEASPPAKIEVVFHPEGGELAANLENRVYFTARDPTGAPAEIKGTIINSSGVEVALVQSARQGRGAFHFTPLAGEQYRLKINSPEGVKDEPALPGASTGLRVVLSAGSGVFKAGEPLEFNIRCAVDDLPRPLVVAARCRGVQVGQQWLVANSKGTNGETEDGANAVSIPLSKEVGGAIRLAVYDYSDSPPKLAAQRLVYRQMPKSLRIDTTSVRDHQGGGERVNMTIATSDEKGGPMPAVLSAAVVEDRLLNIAGKRPPVMPIFFLLTDKSAQGEDLNDAGLFFTDTAEARTSLDLLLGTQDLREPMDKTANPVKPLASSEEQTAASVTMADHAPPLMYDNLKDIRDNYDKSVSEYRQRRTHLLNTLTTVSFLGGMGLLLLVAMLGLMKIVGGIHLWMPAMAATICCLVLGAILMDPSRLNSKEAEATAFVPFQAPLPPENKSVKNETISKGGDQAVKQSADVEKPNQSRVWKTFAGTVFWRPMLVTGTDGRASITFDLPDSSTPFRVLIDGHAAEGRIGSHQELIKE
jgi:hypothetical protein